MLNWFRSMGDPITELSAYRQLVQGGDPLLQDRLAAMGQKINQSDIYGQARKLVSEVTLPFNVGDTQFPAGKSGNWSLRVPCPSWVWFIAAGDGEDLFIEIPDDVHWQLLKDRIAIEPVKLVIDDLENGQPKLYIARYETMTPGGSWRYAVEVPERVRTYADELGVEIRGYIDFIMGPPCSIDSLMLVGEETGKDIGEATCLVGGNQFPPQPEEFFAGPGVLLASVFGVEEANVEILADDLLGEPVPVVHGWLRVFLTEELPWPVPGEFLGMAYRPWPNAAWFFQESSPCLYSANWFETDCYSSGVITEIIPEGGPGGIGNVGATYRVRVKAESVLAKSTDFAEYAVDDRVALLKKWDSTAGSMAWRDLGVFENWVILPVWFYSE